MDQPLIIASDKSSVKIREIIDIKELTLLFQNYSDITGMVTALLDLEGEVLIATNWQDSCTKFHRINDTTSARCHESDTALASQLEEGKQYNIYRCKNGLVDVATPVMINNHHVANLFTGQFFLQQPNMDYFSQQADQVGFEKGSYLQAIGKVPVYDMETIQGHLKFLEKLAEVVGKMGMAKLQIMEANEQLALQQQSLQVQVENQTAEIKQSLEAANSANQAKSKFLANMSHELRTPLNAILGFSEVLENRESDSSKKQLLQSINLAGKGLLNLINSILDLSKIESGKMLIQKVPFSLALLAEEMESIFERQTLEKGLQLIVSVSVETQPIIFFDEVKIRQIMINLISNAIKFTASGTIKLVISTEPIEGDRSVNLTISIEDTGKGINLSDQQRIFNSFEQAENQSISEYGGTGLGLTLCKNLIELLGGSLSIESRVNIGTTFTCHFPNIEPGEERRLIDRYKDEKSEKIRFLPAKIIAADDNPMNLQLIIEHLREYNLEILQATNGQEAATLAATEKPDLILMDIKMPVMDGVRATQIIKNDSATQHIPVIAVTASVLSQNKAAVIKETDAYLRKPYRKTELIAVLKRFLPTADPVSASSIASTPIATVLLVDDNAMNTLLLEGILEDLQRFNITTASSGQEAITNTEAQNFDFILMDCEMPGMNGIEATKIIRKLQQRNGQEKSMIFAVTGHTEQELMEIYGDDIKIFNGIISKPIEVEKIDTLLINN